MKTLPTTTVTILDHAKIAANCRARRIAAGKTLHDVSSAMGISNPHLSCLERGLRNWSPELVDAFERNT